MNIKSFFEGILDEIMLTGINLTRYKKEYLFVSFSILVIVATVINIRVIYSFNLNNMNEFMIIFSNFSSRNAINFHSIYEFRIILAFFIVIFTEFFFWTYQIYFFKRNKIVA
ncbi:hypothetical protein [Campylobacter molothri]|uniref:hypothetical protein n=1 Tax=Campylobacter molothri TaxID=1032242 RepID=UPI0035B0D097